MRRVWCYYLLHSTMTESVGGADAVKELLNAFSRFLTRDLTFMLGGITVISAFFYCVSDLRVSRLPWPAMDVPVVAALFIAGLGYAVGYAVQDLFCLFRVVTVANYFVPGTLSKVLFRLYHQVPWEPVAKFNVDEVRTKVDLGPAPLHFRLERLITLKLVGATMGPSFFVTAVLLAIKWVRHHDAPDLALAICLMALAGVLIALAKIKACEQLKYMAYIDRICQAPQIHLSTTAR